MIGLRSNSSTLYIVYYYPKYISTRMTGFMVIISLRLIELILRNTIVTLNQKRQIVIYNTSQLFVNLYHFFEIESMIFPLTLSNTKEEVFKQKFLKVSCISAFMYRSSKYSHQILAWCQSHSISFLGGCSSVVSCFPKYRVSKMYSTFLSLDWYTQITPKVNLFFK